MINLLGSAPAIAVGLVVSFLAQALFARIVGPEVFGVYIYALTWASGAALLAKGGQEWVLLKVVPSCIQEGAWGQIRFTVERAFAIVARRAVFLAALLAVLGVASGRLSNWSILAVAFALVVTLALAELRRSWALAHREIWLSDAPESIVKSLVLLVVALGFASSGQALNPVTLLWVNVAATGLTALLATVVLLWVRAPDIMRSIAEPVDTSDYDSVARGMWLATAANIVLRSADVIVVGIVMDPETTAIYAVASRIAALAAAPSIVLQRVATPMMSAAAAVGDNAEIRRISRAYVALTTAASVTILLLVLVAGEHAIGALFGGAYLEAELAAKILLFGHVAIALIGPAGLLMAVSGGQTESAVISACSAAIGLLLLAVLTTEFGPIGAAAAMSFALILKSFASAVWVWRTTGVHTTFLAMGRSI